jgi:hypothetical protein
MGRVSSTHGAKRNTYRIWWESQNESGHQEVLDVGGRIVLKRVLDK